ncbi:MAG: hypothetical protein ACREP8_03420 [Candidatus Binatia bacterium]
MSFDPIHLDQIQRANILTTTVRPVVGGTLVNKPTFAQKFMSGLKMFGAIFGKIGGSLLGAFPFFPGAQIASAGLYGLGNLAQQSHQDGINKRMNELAMDEAASQSNMIALTPGFGMFGAPNGANPMSGPMGGPTVAPAPGQELAWGTVLNREAAASEQIQNL